MQALFRLSEFATEALTRFDDIVCLIGDRNYTQIWLRDGRCIVASKTLECIERTLPPAFVRVHKRHAVNRAYVATFQKHPQGGWIHLRDGRVLTVARRRLTEVCKMFKNHL
jgi:two-component system, LytTR family, response regulator